MAERNRANAQEFYCSDCEVLWIEDVGGTNPGCWQCGALGVAREMTGFRATLAELAGFAGEAKPKRY